MKEMFCKNKPRGMGMLLSQNKVDFRENWIKEKLGRHLNRLGGSLEKVLSCGTWMAEMKI